MNIWKARVSDPSGKCSLNRTSSIPNIIGDLMTLQFLTTVLNIFCSNNGLPFQSADDLRHNYQITLTKYQENWLEQYGKVWDIVVENAD